jgi:hypothetical protein
VFILHIYVGFKRKKHAGRLITVHASVHGRAGAPGWMRHCFIFWSDIQKMRQRLGLFLLG